MSSHFSAILLSVYEENSFPVVKMLYMISTIFFKSLQAWNLSNIKLQITCTISHISNIKPLANVLSLRGLYLPVPFLPAVWLYLCPLSFEV